MDTLRSPNEQASGCGRSDGQVDGNDAMLESAQPLSKESPQETGAYEKWEQSDRQAAVPARLQEQLRLPVLVLLQGYDFGQPFLSHALCGRVDRWWARVAHQHRTQVVCGDQGIAQRDVEALTANGRHRVRR